MRRIGVDLRVLPADGSPGAGIAHAARALWQAMLPLASFYDLTLVGFAPQKALVGKGKVVRLQGASGDALRQALKKNEVDALFVPGGAIPPGVKIPTYPWVHDLAIFDHPTWFPQSLFKRFLTKRLYLDGLKKAPHVFAISEDTKTMIRKRAKLPLYDITVTYEGADLKRIRRAKPEEPFALILGTVQPRKNIPFILSLWPEVCRRLKKTVSLVIAGEDGWGDVSISPTIAGVKRYRHFSDAERNGFLQDASMVLLPSLHEGFGLVALEAMTLGTPTLAIDRRALPAGIGCCGRTQPCAEPEQWIREIVKLFTYPAYAAEWGKRGQKQAARFSWEKTARKILAILAKDC